MTERSDLVRLLPRQRKSSSSERGSIPSIGGSFDNPHGRFSIVAHTTRLVNVDVSVPGLLAFLADFV